MRLEELCCVFYLSAPVRRAHAAFPRFHAFVMLDRLRNSMIMLRIFCSCQNGRCHVNKWKDEHYVAMAGRKMTEINCSFEAARQLLRWNISLQVTLHELTPPINENTCEFEYEHVTAPVVLIGSFAWQSCDDWICMCLKYSWKSTRDHLFLRCVMMNLVAFSVDAWPWPKLSAASLKPNFLFVSISLSAVI